ncbi:MAG: hypothetical protein KKA05_01070 [Alphaproteobacteria bacterium]|nr:hypothetical protein [Alphaproteobacteria bacterium]
MTKITLHHHLSDSRTISMEFEDIASMKRGDDARFHPEGPSHFTAITLKPGCRTSAGVGTAYVRETEREIKAAAAMARANQFRL